MLGTFYDQSGKLVWVADQYIDRALQPQTPVSFRITVPEDLARKVSNERAFTASYRRGERAMRSRLAILLSGALVALVPLARSQSGRISGPKTIAAGSSFSLQSSGSGTGILYIVGSGQIVRKDVQLGSAINFPAGTLYNADHYLIVLASNESTESIFFGCLTFG